jgi:site-specific recombinase XerD
VLQEFDAATRHTVLAALEKLKLHGANITEAVDFFLKHSRPTKGSITIGELIKQWLKVKRGAGMTEKYLQNAKRCFLLPFKDHVNDCKVTDITKEIGQKYLYSHQAHWNNVTLASHLRHLSTLFNFAVHEGYSTYNPFNKVQKPKKEASTAKEKVMPVAAVQALLQYALDTEHKAECASLVLTYFCGVRMEEVTRIKWEDIKLEEEIPIIVIDYPKITHQRRINTLSDNAIEWLKKCKDKGDVAPPNYIERMQRLRQRFIRDQKKQIEAEKQPKDETGTRKKKPRKEYYFPKGVDLSYHQNSARICFASYHIAAYGKPGETSLMLGHQNSALLWNTYRALVTKGDAEKYWRIKPGHDATVDIPIDPKQRFKRVAKAVNAPAPLPLASE